MFTFKEPGWVIRKIELQNQSQQVFLTFDDGPCPVTTPQVLNLLKKHGAQATFFVIGMQACKHPDIIRRMLDEGHGVHSHSTDHNYLNYFKSDKKTRDWIQKSLRELQGLTQIEQLTFRPPAGILTPPVLRSARQLETPIVLWNHRFYDSSTRLTEKKIQARISKINTGDIILLHDKQKEKNRTAFLRALHFFLTELKYLNFEPRALTNSIIRLACRFS